MKKIISTFILTSCVLLFSCNSGKIAQSDSYDFNLESSATQDKKEDSGFSWKKAFGSNKFTIVDELTLNTTTFTNNIESQNGVIAIYDKKQIAAFGSSYMLAYYFVSLEQEGRQKLAIAIDQYFNDFENKLLDRKGKNTFKKYGKIDVRLDWGTIQSSTPNYGVTKASLGYEFKNNSPYFTITIFSTNNLREDLQPIDRDDSMKLTYHFTKAQALALKNFMSDEYLSKYLNIQKYENYNDDEEKKTPQVDEYL